MRSATFSADITEDIDEMMITEVNAFLENEDDWETENCDVANGDDPGDNEDETDMDGNSIDTNNDGLSSENVAGLVNTEDNEDVSDECSDDSIVLNCIFFDACGDLVGDSDGREKIDRDNFAKEDTIWITESTWIVLSVVVFNKPFEEDAMNAGEDALILVKRNEGQVKTGAKVKDWFDDTSLTIRFRESVWGIWSWVAAFDSSAEWE